MRGMQAALIGVAALSALIAAAPFAATSNAGPPKKSSRWLVTASVPNGRQLLTRIEDSSNRGHHGAGNSDSHWRAQWKVRVRVIDGQMVIPGATAFSVTGGATGEYRGYYPKPGGVTGTYTCPFGTITPKQVLARLHFQGFVDRQDNVGLTFGVDGEPAALPPLACSGDVVEPEVAKTISGGILTGIESACYRIPSIKRAQFRARKPFTVFKQFEWDPPSPSGESRSCNGIGAPVWSTGSGKLRLRFVPIA
jgi:hypothetical protein